MSAFDATGTAPPWVIFVPRGTTQIQQQLSALQSAGGHTYRFAASALLTEQDIHRTFATTLQFPGYYGRNWHALVDCLDDLCGAVTGRIGLAAVITDADQLLNAPFFPLLVSVLCQAADRANASTDLDGFPLDRPPIAEHFIFEFSDFDGERITRTVSQPDLTVTTGDAFVAAELNPDEWH
ncbi:barstar family protein [Streptomyces sp. NPDC004732]|uniref:barstar family protein n=1 Tax=Streptomyces sp. NPDC004732 TaxID=3154290 RepID=UPI0033AF11A2